MFLLNLKRSGDLPVSSEVLIHVKSTNTSKSLPLEDDNLTRIRPKINIIVFFKMVEILIWNNIIFRREVFIRFFIIPYK